jgi:hypothetical protein
LWGRLREPQSTIELCLSFPMTEALEGIGISQRDRLSKMEADPEVSISS